MAKIPLLGSPTESQQIPHPRVDTRHAMQELEKLNKVREGEANAFLKMSSNLYSSINTSASASSLARSKQDIKAYDEQRQSEKFNEKGEPLFANLIDDSAKAYGEIYEKNKPSAWLVTARDEYKKTFDSISANALLSVGGVARTQRLDFLEAESSQTIASIVDFGVGGNEKDFNKALVNVTAYIYDMRNDGLYSPKTAYELIVKSRDAIGTGFLTKFINYDPEIAKLYIEVNSSESLGISEAKRQDFLVKADSALQSRDKQRRDDAKAGAKDAVIRGNAEKLVNGDPSVVLLKPEAIEASRSYLLEKLTDKALNVDGLNVSEMKRLYGALSYVQGLHPTLMPQTSAFISAGFLTTKNEEHMTYAYKMWRTIRSEDPNVAEDTPENRVGDKVLLYEKGGGEVTPEVIDTARASVTGDVAVNEREHNITRYKARDAQYKTKNGMPFAQGVVRELMEPYFPKGNETLTYALEERFKNYYYLTGSEEAASDMITKYLEKNMGKASYGTKEYTLSPVTNSNVFNTDREVERVFVEAYFGTMSHLFPEGTTIEHLRLEPIENALDPKQGTMTYGVFYYNPDTRNKTGLVNQIVLNGYGGALTITFPKYLLDYITDAVRDGDFRKKVIEAKSYTDLSVDYINNGLTPSEQAIRDTEKENRERVDTVRDKNKINDEISKYLEQIFTFDKNTGATVVNMTPMNNQKKNQEITALLSAWFNLAGTNKATMLKGDVISNFNDYFDVDVVNLFDSKQAFFDAILPADEPANGGNNEN